MKLGRKLRWDAAAERFVNDDEANGLLGRPQRAKYGTDALHPVFPGVLHPEFSLFLLAASRLLFLTKGKKPAYLEQPVYVLIEVVEEDVAGASASKVAPTQADKGAPGNNDPDI